MSLTVEEIDAFASATREAMAVKIAAATRPLLERILRLEAQLEAHGLGAERPEDKAS